MGKTTVRFRLLIAVLALAGIASCRSDNTSRVPFDGIFFVSGRVTSDNTPLPNAFVILEFDPPHAVPEIGATDEAGNFRLGSIIGQGPTRYRLTFAKEGFQTTSQSATYPDTKIVVADLRRVPRT
jgi:hypothetical protein